MSSSQTPSSSWLTRLWRKLRGQPAEPEVVTLRAAEPTRARREIRGIEPLEGRIAPATLLPGLNGITYSDPDGDVVTVTFSKPLFAGTDATVNALLASVFTFSSGKAHVGDANPTDDPAAGQTLRLIDLTKLTPTAAAGLSVFVTSVLGPDEPFGNGTANVGHINATNIALKTVVVDGDLGQIDAGGNATPVAINSLTVKTLGKETTTQGGTPSYESKITGTLGTFRAESVEGGYLNVVNGSSFVNGAPLAKGNLGTLIIEKQLRARTLETDTQTPDPDPAEDPPDNDGQIRVAGNVTKIILGSGARGDSSQAFDGVRGGAGADSGTILVTGNIGSLLVNGDIAGGTGTNSGSISASGNIAKTVVNGALVGGGGDFSGSVRATGLMNSVTVGLGTGDALKAGFGNSSGIVQSDSGMGVVLVKGDIDGLLTGSGENSGGISSKGNLTRITVTGDVIGGKELQTGFIEAQLNFGTGVINGDLLGGDGENSGIIVGGFNFTSLKILGDVVGGKGDFSGSVAASIYNLGGRLGAVSIGGGLLGGEGDGSGALSSGGVLGAVTIGLASEGISVQGSLGPLSGSIYAGFGFTSIKLAGALAGGAGDYSGSIQSVGASGVLSTAGLYGGGGDYSGAVLIQDLHTTSTDIFGTLKSGSLGEIRGGVGDYSGFFSADGDVRQLLVTALYDQAPGNNIIAGVDSATIRVGAGMLANGDLGMLRITKFGSAADAVTGGSVNVNGTLTSFVGGELFGANLSAGRLGVVTATSVTDSTIRGEGGVTSERARTDLAIKAINISGNVANSLFLAGYDDLDFAVNGHAQIGSVFVRGSWTASSLVAGVVDVSDDGFGDADDVRIAMDDGYNIISKIGSITIRGVIAGTAAAGDQFGFTAATLGVLKIPASLPADVAARAIPA